LERVPPGKGQASTKQHQSSAHRFLHERGDLGLFGASQLLQCEDDRPQSALVEVRLLRETDHHVPIIVGSARIHPEVAHDFAVPGIGRQAIPGFRREGGRAGFDESMEPLAYRTIRGGHLGDGREHGTFSIRLVRL